jgi:Kef-type K+ transport system membrane component KefB/nucleotide-binding universal stress UspA family protein
MDPTTLPPISGHAILLLLLQLAGVLALARVFSELMRRLRQPAVIGELLAGIVLGPSVLGHYLPRLSTAFFPPTIRQFHLLEAISWIGMVLLLLLTGLETDVRVMRSLGRAALFTSLGGMLVNFAVGGTLGWMLPAQYLTDPATRPIFAAFFATALAITAMPVVAKILIDLGLIRRNIGVVILSAGVLDDTTGWIVLSVIAGIASEGAFSERKLALTLAGLVGYVLAMRYVVFPTFARLLRYVNERVQLAGADVTLILVFTFLSAASTEALGIHAVFGAFAMGVLVRQTPRLRGTSLHAIETFVLAALSPVFFAFVGLKVNLWALSGWELPALVIGLAVAGKLIGCYGGGRLGGLGYWEAIAVGVGMNARGAMGLVVALIGLSLGLLTAEMYSTIVLVAVVTSFLAPLLLRFIIPKLVMTEEERRRVSDESRPRLLPVGPLRILVPTAGGPNAAATFAIAAPVVRTNGGSLVALYIEAVQRRRRRVLSWFFNGSTGLAGKGIDSHLARAADRFDGDRRLFAVKRTSSADPVGTVIEESARDYDLLMIGAAPRHLSESSLTGKVVASARIPVVLVRAAGEISERFERVLVPLDGSVFSRAAAEFAFAYARAAGASVTLLHVVNEARVSIGAVTVTETHASHEIAGAEHALLAAHVRDEYQAFADADTGFDVRILASGDPADTILEAANAGDFDLLVLGAENKMLARPLFFGQGTSAIMERAGCTTAVVVPVMR